MVYHAVTIPLAPAATRTTDGEGKPVPVGEFLEAQVLLDITAAAGTLDVVIETSPDQVAWFTHTSFPTKSSTGRDQLFLTNLGQFMRARWDMGGASPSFDFAVTLVGKGLY